MTWLYRIATTYCLQQIRNDSRRREKLRKLVQPPRSHLDSSLEADLSIVECLEKADETTSRIAVCRFVDGMTLQEVAELMGYSRKTVQKKIKEFVKMARAALGETLV